MRTSKPISTISYNSADFLKAKIEEWKKAGIIEFGMWIYHHPEADEKKGHYHVFLKPARLIQTVDLENDSMEIDPENIDKPFKMIGFRVSKESDWLLYAIHEPTYLLEKGLERMYVYSFDDLESTCIDTLADIISHSNDERKGKVEVRIAQLIDHGLTWEQIVKSGFIPVRYMHGAKMIFDALARYTS